MQYCRPSLYTASVFGLGTNLPVQLPSLTKPSETMVSRKSSLQGSPNDSSDPILTTAIHMANTNNKKKPHFKRNYVACLNCRTRKVKCDLGSVDDPHEPPCARCKRERKECVFVESKRGMISSIGATSNPNTTTPTPLSSNMPPASSSDPHSMGMNPIMAIPAPFFHQGLTSSTRSTSASTSNPNPLLLNKTLSTNFHGSNANINNNSNDTDSSTNTVSNSGAAATAADADADPKEAIADGSYMTSSNPLDPSSQSTLPSVNSSIQSLTNNATMIYLAHVAGKVAHIDPKRRIDGAERHSQLERSVPIPRPSSASNMASTPASVSTSGDTEPIQDSFGHGTDSLTPNVTNARYTIPPLTTSQSMRQKPTTQLCDIEYIASSKDPMEVKQQNILTDVEARRLVKLFFVTLHPFYPYIPSTMRDADVLASYPILLCAILAISARYNPLPETIGNWDDIADDDTVKRRAMRGDRDINMHYHASDRHLEVHEQLWIYCQRLMSMTVWGESSSRSVGTLLTFLLFTEWNPRAIHFRWGDYANDEGDDSLASRKVKRKKNVGAASNGNGFNPRKRTKVSKSGPSNDADTMASDDDDNEEFAGLSAMKRSEIMSFMLIGTATRLSFLLDTDSLIFIATHVSEIHIAVGLNKKSMLQQTLSEVDVNEPTYEFTSYQKANIELLQFFSLCYETLYGTRPKFISLDKYQTLAILDILSPILENWYRKYFKLLRPSNIHCAPLTACNDDGSPDWLYLISQNPKLERDLTVSIERESLILDYYYTKLYLYSLALSGDTSVNANLRNSKKGRNLRLDELARYSRYVELAYKAAKEVLAVIQRVRKLRLLKYMPVRWVTRVIKSVSFIVKCYLTLTTEIPASNGLFYENAEKSGSRSNSANPTTGADYGIGSASVSGVKLERKGSGNVDKVQNTNGEILKLSVIPLEEIITLLQKTAICLRYAAPDELHLCTRYSTILMYLCSQFKTQMRERNEKLKNDVREYEKDVDLNYDEETDPLEEKPHEEHEHSHARAPGVQYRQDDYQSANQQQYHTAYSVQDNMIMRPQMSLPSGNPPLINNITPTYPQSATVDNNQIPPQAAYPSMPHASYDPESINFSNANQELFDDFFNKNPSEKLFNFFSLNDNNNPGLDFVDQFTKEIEKDFLSKGGKH